MVRSDDVIQNNLEILNPEERMSIQIKNPAYEHGWTGYVGVWKNYFSDDNRKDFINVLNNFLSYHPNAHFLLQTYRDIQDPPSIYM